jgi:CheY-like chemotaxis protein/HPt (histidine-containing phosphotransfer) domain-containing protein
VLTGGTTPVVALVDADMPGMDGIAIARAIQTEPGLANVRVVLLSRLTQRHDAKADRAQGVAALLYKPVRRMQLSTCIASVLSDDAYAPPNDTLDQTPAAHAPKTSGSVRAMRETAEPTHGSAYILLAEDNLVNQQVATELLRRLGYRIDIASDGREAVEAAARGVYDAVLMDCQMPHMDGYEATAEIRRRGFDATRLPIIAMTADVLDGSRERCLNAGMNDFLSKPLQRDLMVAALARWTKGSAAMVHESVAAPQARPVTADEILDLGQLRSLVGEDVSTMWRFLDLFLKSSRPVLEEIDLAITSRRADVLRRALHGLKGSALSVGAKAVGERARDLEAAARQEDWTHVGPLHVRLTDALEQTTIITRDFGI